MGKTLHLLAAWAINPGLAVLVPLALTGCATEYQPQSFTGDYTDFMTTLDEAVVPFHRSGGNPRSIWTG
jgi:hypothetical protein